MCPVTQRLEWKGPAGKLRILITAENLDSRLLGGPLNLTLETAFTHNPTPKNGVHSVSETLTVRTRSAPMRPWETDATEHHMTQDLMCLIYGHPGQSRLQGVMRNDDQLGMLEHNKHWWPNVHEPTFGRGTVEGKPLPEDAQPFFYLDDTNPARIPTWLSDFQSWARPTWIAVTTMFQRDSTVEAQLLQIGVALEALGYAIWRRAKPGAIKTPTYIDLLKYITDAVRIQHPLLHGPNVTAGRWRVRFNTAFKGSKHADNTLPSRREAILRTRQGLLLLRCWLALELGVPRILVRERLNKIKDGSWR